MRHEKSSSLLSFTRSAPLVVTLLLVGSVSGYAASPRGTLIGSGQATGGASPALAEQSASVSLRYSLFEQPDGAPSGSATLTSEAGSVEFALTSYTVDADGLLSAAGPATIVVGAPSFGPDSEGPNPHIVELGETLFFSLLDNRGLGVPDVFLEGKVPSFLPPDAIEQSRTINDILAAVPPAPVAIFRQVADGDLNVSSLPGTLIGSGQATGGASPALADQAASVSLQYSLFVHPDGAPSGSATLTSEAGSVEFALTSYIVDADGLLSAAGPATNVHGAPSFGPDSEGPNPHIVQLGETLFFSLLDNRGLGVPDAFLEGKVPSFLPRDVIEQSRTIDQILAAVPPAPAAIFRQVTDGNLNASNLSGNLIASGNVKAASDDDTGFSLRFSLFVKPDGAPSGRATLISEVGSVDFELTSSRIGSDGRVDAAGPVTAVRGTPSFGPDANSGHIVETGEIAFFSIKDKGDGNGPDSFIEGKVPFFLPIEENDTIQKITAIIGEAPGAIFHQVGTGDLIKFPAKRAFATAQVANGIVSGIQVAETGSGYAAEPLVIISGDGSGATAVATVTNGVVTAITVTDSGSGYTSPPDVRIASSPFASKLEIEFIASAMPIEASKVRVWLKVVLGRNYQLETSDDLNAWTAVDDPFVALEEELVEEFDVETTGRFFRIQELP